MLSDLFEKALKVLSKLVRFVHGEQPKLMSLDLFESFKRLGLDERAPFELAALLCIPQSLLVGGCSLDHRRATSLCVACLCLVVFLDCLERLKHSDVEVIAIFSALIFLSLGQEF